MSQSLMIIRAQNHQLNCDVVGYELVHMLAFQALRKLISALHYHFSVWFTVLLNNGQFVIGQRLVEIYY